MRGVAKIGRHAPRGERERVGAIGGDANGWMRNLHGPGHDGEIPRVVVLPLVGEGLVGPRLQDEVERLLEARSALLLWDVVAGVVNRRGAPPDSELQAPVAEQVGGGGLLGGLHRVVQREQRHRGAQADAARALGGGGQDHERVGEGGEGAAEVQLAEPRGVEAQGIAEPRSGP